jgi:hypothetical protein
MVRSVSSTSSLVALALLALASFADAAFNVKHGFCKKSGYCKSHGVCCEGWKCKGNSCVKQAYDNGNGAFANTSPGSQQVEQTTHFVRRKILTQHIVLQTTETTTTALIMAAITETTTRARATGTRTEATTMAT